MSDDSHGKDTMSPPPSKDCPVPGCDYKTAAAIPTYELVYKDLEIHTKYGHPVNTPGSASSSSSRAEKLPRPELKEGSTESDYIFFTDAWERYKRSTGLSGQATVDQLWACCSPELSRCVYDSGVTSSSDETTLLNAMKKLAVRAQNTLVNVVNFLALGQDSDENSTSFSARLRGKAAICNFIVQCKETSCKKDVSYADKMIAHQLVKGLSDGEIQEQVMALAAETPDLDLATIQKFVEAKETGRRSGAIIAGTGGLNRVSDYKNLNQRSRLRSNSQPADLRKCGWCGKPGHGANSSAEIREKKCQAFKAKCEKCGKIGHFKAICRSSIPSHNTMSNTDGQIGPIQAGPFCNLTTKLRKGRKMRTLPHQTYTEFRGWTQRKPESHPAVQVTVSLCRPGYDKLDLPSPRNVDRHKTVSCLPDTGAQMVVAGPNQMHQLGITKRELIPLSNGVSWPSPQH